MIIPIRISIPPVSFTNPHSIGTGNVNLDLLTGPMMFGYLFSYMLYGMLVVQVYVYYNAFPNDAKWLKAFVGVIFLLETALSASLARTAWHTLGSRYGDVGSLVVMDKASMMMPSLTALVALMSHSFYIWRMARLTKGYILPGALALIAITQFVLTVRINIWYGTHGQNLKQLESIRALAFAWGCTTGVTDVCIAISMLVILYRARNASTLRDTVTKVQKVMTFTAETGLIMAVSVVTYLVLFWTRPDTYYPMFLYYIIARLYSNTLLASLNSRFIFNMNKLAACTPFNFGTNPSDQICSTFWREYTTRDLVFLQSDRETIESSRLTQKRIRELRAKSHASARLRERERSVEYDGSGYGCHRNEFDDRYGVEEGREATHGHTSGCERECWGSGRRRSLGRPSTADHVLARPSPSLCSIGTSNVGRSHILSFINPFPMGSRRGSTQAAQGRDSRDGRDCGVDDVELGLELRTLSSYGTASSTMHTGDNDNDTVKQDSFDTLRSRTVDSPPNFALDVE